MTATSGIRNKDFCVSAAADYDRRANDLLIEITSMVVNERGQVLLRCPRLLGPDAYVRLRRGYRNCCGAGSKTSLTRWPQRSDRWARRAVIDYNTMAGRICSSRRCRIAHGHGRFVEDGPRAGVAPSENAPREHGRTLTTTVRSSAPHGNFNEMLGLYHNENGQRFVT